VSAVEDRSLTGVPNYAWWYGCYGVGTGNLMGYWDRNGFPNMYTGPTNGGVAPTNSNMFEGNVGIVSMWASKAGSDGRPFDQPGHVDDYYDQNVNGLMDRFEYESVEEEPYLAAGRAEHAPDCLGDFIGMSQNKWANMNGECNGNINAFAFIFWDHSGMRRRNFQPFDFAGSVMPDLPSGLNRWTEWRGYASDSFSQLTDFNSTVASGAGFTFEELKAEIDAGYPVLCHLQSFEEQSRTVFGRDNMNPRIHAVLAYGYRIVDGLNRVRFRDGWAGLEDHLGHVWGDSAWAAGLPVRGVIGYRPTPRIVSVKVVGENVQLEWHAPDATIRDNLTGTETRIHSYQVERSSSLNPGEFEAVGNPVNKRSTTVPIVEAEDAFFRVRLITRSESE
jgi:hypothetical protein